MRLHFPSFSRAPPCECAAAVDVVGDLTIVIEAFFYPEIDMMIIMIINVVSFNKIHN